MRHRVGCLTGDTVVTFVDINGHSSPRYRKTIDELWRMWTVGEKNGHSLSDEQRGEIDRLAAEGASARAIARRLRAGRRGVSTHLQGEGRYRDSRWRVRRMRLRVLNEETGEFTVGHITDIIDKGVQPVYRLTLADGSHLTVTENHRLLTSEGWKTMGVALGLSGAGTAARMTRECHVMANGVPAHRNYIHRTRATELESIKRLERWHGFARDIDVPQRGGYTLTAHPVKVVAVEYIGDRQTYDLSVGGPWHNFVANGVVVHNSFNEFSMRYAKATDDFYVPEPDDVRTQVGKPGAYSFEPVEPEIAEQTRDELRAVYDAAFAVYERLVELGVARELARCVMPVGAYTEFYWTINARSLMNFVSLRAAETAQREIRRYAEAVEQFFAEQMPVTHAAFVANDRTAP
jgi:thymidylate synthase (FAD)